MDREAWHAAFQEVTKSWTWLSGWTELVLTVLADISKWLWFAFLWGLEIHFNFGGTYICFVWTIYSVCLISFKSDYFTINCMSFFFKLNFIGVWNPRNGRAWWAAVYGVAQSRTQLKWFSSSIVDLQCCVNFCGHCCLVAQSCLTHCDPMNCSFPGSSVLGILQARILEWVAMSFSKGSSQSRNWNFVSCLASGFFTTEPPFLWYSEVNWEIGFDIWVLYILGILMP